MNVVSRVLTASLSSLLIIMPISGTVASPTKAAPDAASVVSNLAASDLPSRFEPAPPFLRHFIYKGIEAVRPHLETEGISLENVSSFVDFERGELVLSVTTALENQEALAKFDTSLSRPDAREIFIKGVEETLRGFGSIKVTQIQELNSLKAIGNQARGFSFRADFQGLPLQLFGEAVAFRHNKTAALVVLGTLNHPPAEIHVQDLAVRLERLISKNQL